MLLEKGAITIFTDAQRRNTSPIFVAISNGNAEMVNLILSYSPDTQRCLTSEGLNMVMFAES